MVAHVFVGHVLLKRPRPKSEEGPLSEHRETQLPPGTRLRQVQQLEICCKLLMLQMLLLSAYGADPFDAYIHLCIYIYMWRTCIYIYSIIFYISPNKNTIVQWKWTWGPFKRTLVFPNQFCQLLRLEGGYLIETARKGRRGQVRSTVLLA